MNKSTKPQWSRLSKLTGFSLALALLLMVASCAPSTPFAIYVTATFFPTTETPAAVQTATPAPTTAVPTETPTVTTTDTHVPPTATETTLLMTNTPSVSGDMTNATSIAPTFTARGPIVGEGYIPPITSEPSPTGEATSEVTGELPTATPTPTLGAPLVSQSLPNLDPSQIGIQLDINLSQNDWFDAMGRIEQLGIDWVKVQIPWRDMQQINRDERDNEFFRRAEQYLEDANRRGLNVLISVVKAPDWARGTTVESGPPNDPNDLANFITILLQEINPGLQRDVLGEYIDAIEIWNEPNLIREWTGNLAFSGAGYMQLFAPSYQAIRAYSSTMPIITAGLAPTGNSAGSIDDREFLRQMYGAGLGAYSDVIVGVHPYSWGNSPDSVCCGTQGWDNDPHFFFADTMRETREIMNANGHANVPIWITELGWASWDGFPNEPPIGSEWMRFNDRWEQAGFTLRALQITETSGNVGPVFLWNLNFAVLGDLARNGDERIAYSMIVPGSSCGIDVDSTNRTERPLFWLLYDAVQHDINLPDHCGVPPNGVLPGLVP